jgi:hypothetical protein
MKKLVCALLLASSTLAATASAQVGSVLHAQRINELDGGFTGALDPDDYFGTAFAALGDLDGDGVEDLAVSAPLDDDGGVDRGAIWILFLNPDGSVASQAKISQTSGGFTGTLADGSVLGHQLATAGDLDGDGAPELAAFCGQPNRLWILFLNANGTLHGQTEIRASDPAFGGVPMARDFSYGGLAALGDTDGDGLGDLALGAPWDDGRAGALWILRLQANGTLKTAHRIAEGVGGFTGDLVPFVYGSSYGDQFGSAIVQLGDLNGDGNRELGVGAQWAEHLGSFWILYMDANEQVLSQIEYGIDDYGLPLPSGSYGTSHQFGWLGDLDGDGVGELALEFTGVDLQGGPLYEGAVVVAFPRSDGSIQKRLVISHQRGGLGNLIRGTGFGNAPTLIGDLDGDGGPEMAVGAYYDRSSGEDTGAAWILALDPDVVRNGSGANPLTLSQTADPVIGQAWSATLDCSAHGSGMALLAGWSRPLSGVFLSAGELLVDTAGGVRFFQLAAPHAGGPVGFAAALPPDPALISLTVHVQGLCSGAPGARLSNALDVLVGQ